METTIAPQVQNASQKEIEDIFQKQKGHEYVLFSQQAQERTARLKKLQAALINRLAEAKEATYNDFKKPEVETLLGEILGINGEINYTIKHLPRWMRPQRVSTPLTAIGTSSYIQYEAKGKALIIAPWNYPISLALKPLVSAIAAGCTVIIKPSELTPHSSAFVRKIVEEVFPPEEVAVVEGDASVAQALLELPFNHIFFTGSPAIGKVVMRAAANHLASVTLELGGKSPCIVDESADLKTTAEKIAWGKFINNGQTCIAPDYLFVHSSVADTLETELRSAIQRMYRPDGRQISDSDSYCRIVNQRHFQRLKGYLDDALEKGAEVVVGGKTDASDNFMEPTVLRNVSADMRLMQDEIFGPILPILTYEDPTEVVSFINANEKPLALYVNSTNAKSIEYFLKNTSAGDALVNEFLLQFGHHEIPFGGVNNSGIGKSNGFFGFQEFSNMKGVMKRKFGTMKFVFPPYTDRVKKIVNTLIRWA
jgi:aldehyde dehydrogenase (NAD+)